MWLAGEVDVLGVGLLATALSLAAAAASSPLDDFYTAEYVDYYPTLFRRDHRQFFAGVDHRHFYCDCSMYGRRANVSAQARVGVGPASDFSPLVSGNNTDLVSIVALDNTHHAELDSLDTLDTDHSSMTSSSLTGYQQRQQQQLIYVVVPCVIAIILVVVAVTIIIISLLRRRLRYVGKNCEQEAVNLTSFGAVQPPPISGLQLCASQQHQLLLDTLRHPADVTAGDDQSRAADKQAPASASAGDSSYPYPDWTFNSFAPARQVRLTPAGAFTVGGTHYRKEVTVKCYLDTSAVRAVLVPKTSRP